MFESERAVAYGINTPLIWFSARGLPPGAGYGHLALQASGKAAVDAAYAAGLANGGSDDGAPAQRPRYGRRYYAAYLRDHFAKQEEVMAKRAALVLELYKSAPDHARVPALSMTRTSVGL